MAVQAGARDGSCNTLMRLGLAFGVARCLLPAKLASWSDQIRAIRRHESSLAGVSDGELTKRGLALRYRALSGEPLSRLLAEAYALVGEAAHRSLNMRPYDVQLAGAVAIHNGSIAEMQTGEGKTLTATMPIFLASLMGKGAHLATANDYLANRDAQWMRPVYEMLSASVGVIQSQMPREQRGLAYKCDITYGTAKEFGFDFLRDRLLDKFQSDCGRTTVAEMLGHRSGGAGGSPVQRPLYFALIDEADSILIDEARTPLIVSSLPGNSEHVAEQLYRWAAETAPQFSADEHTYDARSQRVTLNPAGRRLVRAVSKPDCLAEIGLIDLYDHVERAIKVARDYQLDRHYVIQDGEVVIVDEFTGRLATGRRWRDGIHQAIEAKEGLQISHATGDAARITVQDYFQRYHRLGGMTGTAASSRGEFRKIYRLRAVTMPTNRPPQRTRLPDLVFATNEEKWKAIVKEVASMNELGRPVLVGTRSIDKSDTVSKLLAAEGIAHQVLNARQVAAEAEIVAQAGQVGKVTVATNMAGRGTDIQLSQAAYDTGGLHVICSELHESARIDRQLIGRCGRQGDPGSFRQFLALDDDILQSGLGERRAARLSRRSTVTAAETPRLARLFRRAQSKLERQHFRQRKLLLYHEKERSRLQQEMGQDPYLDSPG